MFGSFGGVARLAAFAFAMLASGAHAEGMPPVNQPVEAHLDAAAKRAVAGIDAFALDLYKQSISPGANSAEQNLLISPASVSTAIGLAYRGARGATAEELRAVMHFSASPQAYLPADARVLQSLNVAGEGRLLRVSNAIWIQQDFPFCPDFLADMTNYARAGLQRIDFHANPDAARQAVNRWVAAATNDRIRNFLQDGDVTEDTRSVLVNSIYWKGTWQAPFETSATRTEPFTGLDGSATQTALMHQQGYFQVAERDGVKAIALPYAGDDVSMVVVLPDAATALPRFERALTVDALQGWLDALDHAEPRDTVLTLPKMHLEWRRDLVPTLQALGARTAFGDKADFSGMVPDASGAAALKIRTVIHQTFIDVDEQGTEAAAATAVGIEMTAARREPVPPFVFRADKPFLFILRDRRTNLILFMGRYVSAG